MGSVESILRKIGSEFGVEMLPSMPCTKGRLEVVSPTTQPYAKSWVGCGRGGIAFALWLRQRVKTI